MTTKYTAKKAKEPAAVDSDACPVCRRWDPVFNEVGYNAALAGMLAVRIVRERVGLFSDADVGRLMNSAAALSDELGHHEIHVREVLAWLLAEGTGEDTEADKKPARRRASA